MAEVRIFAFECRAKGSDIFSLVNAPTAGKARYRYWLTASDAWPELKLVDVTVRKAGPPHTDEMLRYVGKLRGRPLEAGDRVTLRSGEAGVIVGSCSGANFEVWLDGGASGFYHPGDIEEAPRG